MSQIDEEWCRSIHQRLLAADPTATAELLEKVTDAVVERLQKKFPRVDQDMRLDACWQGIGDYLRRPSGFDPTQRGLVGYLVMAAEGDLLNALKKLGRQPEGHLDRNVELSVLSGNTRQEEREARMDVERMLDRLFTAPADRKAAQLMFVEGERSTAAFAEVWGWAHLPSEKQSIEVKRGKDRLKKALERHGEELRGRKR